MGYLFYPGKVPGGTTWSLSNGLVGPLLFCDKVQVMCGISQSQCAIFLLLSSPQENWFEDSVFFSVPASNLSAGTKVILLGCVVTL